MYMYAGQYSVLCACMQDSTVCCVHVFSCAMFIFACHIYYYSFVEKFSLSVSISCVAFVVLLG